MTTVMITGCSSGFGLATAQHFLDRGWCVVATMRRPAADLLPASDRLKVLPLDVCDPASIASAVAAAGEIDVLVNNAGVGWLGPLEGTSPETIRWLFETNTFGAMETVRAVLPQFRARGAGTIVNVSSSTTLMPLPLLSVYTATKAAMNAFTECLALELAPFGIQTRLVLPGRAPGTDFADNARTNMAEAAAAPDAYSPMLEAVMGRLGETGEPLTETPDVVAAIWRAATDRSCPPRLAAGADAEALAA
ncbi:MAG: SDR family oxidoreductase [Acuticoccus sp.]